MEIVIPKSTNINEKPDAKINGSKKVGVGDSNYGDFTKHKDKERKERYVDRHKK